MEQQQRCFDGTAGQGSQKRNQQGQGEVHVRLPAISFSVVSNFVSRSKIIGKTLRSNNLTYE